MGVSYRRPRPLALLTVVAVVVALQPVYPLWWWYDVLTHALIAGLLAVWGHAIGVRPRLLWPAFVAAMLAWEWLELSTPLLLSPTRGDLLMDLTVNLVAFGAVTAWLAVRHGGTDGSGPGRTNPGPRP